MIFNKKEHSSNLYNILLKLSRNKFFYESTKLPDSPETRIYLMFIHFSIFMIIFKKKGAKFDQKHYDFFFHNIENDLRELGYGDVSVNKKMKDLNKILYDILLKIENRHSNNVFKTNSSVVFKYFEDLKDEKNEKFIIFDDYFTKFYDFCFELPLESMVRNSLKFKL